MQLSMSKENFRIIFMGTPEFAVASLKKLVEENFNVVAVITAPDKPKGRGKQLGTSAVKDYAVSQNLPLLQPTNLKDSDFIEELKSYKADLQIVVAFRMLPEVVWNMPPLGSYNLHGSLLPNYRGAAPINWAVINGEKETGVTTFKLKHDIDTGNILFQEKEPIRYEDNVGTVYERLMHLGANLIVKTVKEVQADNYELKAQMTKGELKHAPKIFRENCEINWNQPAEKVRDFIRGLSPYPAAWTKIENQIFKLYEVEKSPSKHIGEPGSIISDNKTYIDIVTSDHPLRIKDLQMQGKKRMKTEDFLRGYQINSLK